MEYLIIDPSTRKITIPKSEQLFGVYGEGNIERKHFKCPKIVGDGLARQMGMSGSRVCMDGKRYKWTRQSER